MLFGILLRKWEKFSFLCLFFSCFSVSSSSCYKFWCFVCACCYTLVQHWKCIILDSFVLVVCFLILFRMFSSPFYTKDVQIYIWCLWNFIHFMFVMLYFIAYTVMLYYYYICVSCHFHKYTIVININEIIHKIVCCASY